MRVVGRNINRDSRGFAMMEMLVSVGIVAIFLAGISSTLLATTRVFHDKNIVSKTQERARILLDLMAFDLRMTGAGVPFSQDDFQIGTGALGDAPLPVLTSADTDLVTLRFNERGMRTVLTSDFDPSAVGRTLDVVSSTGFTAGDTVYISNLSAGEEGGCRGLIVATSATTITLDGAVDASAGATFESGSTIDVVNEITYSSVLWDGITRDNTVVNVTLYPETQLEIEYRDSTGATMTPPLSATNIRDDLSSIILTARVRSDVPLRDGSTYIATAEQEVALRNLILSRN